MRLRLRIWTTITILPPLRLRKSRRFLSPPHPRPRRSSYRHQQCISRASKTPRQRRRKRQSSLKSQRLSKRCRHLKCRQRSKRRPAPKPSANRFPFRRKSSLNQLSRERRKFRNRKQNQLHKVNPSLIKFPRLRAFYPCPKLRNPSLNLFPRISLKTLLRAARWPASARFVIRSSRPRLRRKLFQPSL